MFQANQASFSMATLNGKNILLGITGGIAAYKSAELCRLLRKQNAVVRVVMTRGACEFISPLTFQALSGNPVHTQLLDSDAEAGMGHIELAKWPDLIIVAPATANFIAKYSQGLADDLLLTLLIASTAPVAIAPAMNQAMWSNPLTQRNIRELQTALLEQVTFLGPAEGEQACGDIGAGRMLEASELCDAVEEVLAVLLDADAGPLSGQRVVITAGPTREAIDPVRYISNHSSGKMGYALAAACAEQGADVVLVSGPVQIERPKQVKVAMVESATEMMSSVDQEIALGCDIFISAAAVADYSPVMVADQKMKKKGEDDVVLNLTQNVDIVATVAARPSKPYVVGFAAETNDVLNYAKGKLVKKNLDMIVANDVSRSDIGFNSDHNAVHIITANEIIEVPKQSKKELARSIVKSIVLNSKTRKSTTKLDKKG